MKKKYVQKNAAKKKKIKIKMRYKLKPLNVYLFVLFYLHTMVTYMEPFSHDSK